MADAKYEPRLKTEYVGRVRKAMQEQFAYANEMQIPRVDKIVIN
ncbi:MAG: 50S ribosomal protein L5, partial [Hoeflea sp.]